MWFCWLTSEFCANTFFDSNFIGTSCSLCNEGILVVEVSTNFPRIYRAKGIPGHAKGTRDAWWNHLEFGDQAPKTNFGDGLVGSPAEMVEDYLMCFPDFLSEFPVVKQNSCNLTAPKPEGFIISSMITFQNLKNWRIQNMFFFFFRCPFCCVRLFLGSGTRLNPGRVDWWNASLIHFVLLEEKAWHETLQYVLTIVPPIKSFSPMISDLSRSQGFWNMFPFLGSILKTVMLIDSLLHSLLGTSVALPPDVFKRSLRFDDRMSKVGVLELFFLLLETLADIILKVKMGYLQAKPRRCPKSSPFR